MTVDNHDHSNNEGPLEWDVAPIPPDREIHDLAEAQNGAFQYVFDQLDLEKRENPDNFAMHMSNYKPLLKLSRGPRQRIINHFVRATLKPEATAPPVLVSKPPIKEELTPEERYQEILEDTAGFPSYEARAMAKGEEMVIPTPQSIVRPIYYEPVEIVDTEPDVFRRGPLNDAFIEAELGSLTSEETLADEEKIPKIESLLAGDDEPIKFGIEPDGSVTHTRREQKSAKKLRGEDFSKGGGLKYLKFVSGFGDKTPEERVETMTKSLNHMFDYEENARLTMDSLEALMRLISENARAEDELLGEQPFMKKPSLIIWRALGAITCYREAIDATNNPKVRVKGTIEERLEATILGDTVDNIETTAAELYFREEERQKLWDLQLHGIPSANSSKIPERFGAIDIVKDVPELEPIVEARLLKKAADAVDKMAS